MFETLLAYIDPGSGTILIQLLIGAIAGGAVFFRQKIIGLFNLFHRSADPIDQKPTDHASWEEDRIPGK